MIHARLWTQEQGDARLVLQILVMTVQHDLASGQLSQRASHVHTTVGICVEC